MAPKWLWIRSSEELFLQEALEIIQFLDYFGHHLDRKETK